jgi:hypothetical protein
MEDLGFHERRLIVDAAAAATSGSRRKERSILQ